MDVLGRAATVVKPNHVKEDDVRVLIRKGIITCPSDMTDDAKCCQRFRLIIPKTAS